MSTSTIADRARTLVGRTVTVTLAGVESEPYPITGRLGRVHEDVYLDLVDVPDRDRPTVRVMIASIASIDPTIAERKAEALQLWRQTWDAFDEELFYGGYTEHHVQEVSQQIDDALARGLAQEDILQAAHHAGGTFRTDLDYFLPRQ